MVFAELYKQSTGWNGLDFSGPVVPVPALGSDGVVRLDGRLSLNNNIAVAIAAAKKRPGVVGLKICRGRSFSDSEPITGYISVE